MYSNYPLTYLVKGIRNVGTNLATQMYCNEFYENKHGIYFEHGPAATTIISNQGDSTRPSDNLWTNNVGLRMGGNINLSGAAQRKWYFRGNGGADMQPFNPQIPPNSLLNIPFLEMPGININSICASPGYNPNDNSQMLMVRDERFGEIVREEIEWAQLAEEFDYFNGEYFWEEFNGEYDWINLGSPDDIVYQNFYNYIYNSNISDFWYIRQLMDDGSFEQALQENQNLIAENTLEENLQFINNVYLEYIVNDAEIPPHIEAGLWDLAGLTPWIGGSAVYTARIILGYDPDEHGVPYRLKDTTRVLSRKQNVLVYPNPVTDVVQLKFSNETEGSSMFRLYDYTGKLVFEKEISNKTKNTEINLISVGKGLFMYSINGKNLNVSGKLIKY